MIDVIMRREHSDTPGERHVYTHGVTTCGHREKVAICEPRKEASEAKPADTLILDFQPPAL